MTTVIQDPALAERIIAERREAGADRYDEVWEGVYIMAPMANNERQELVTGISRVLYEAVKEQQLGDVFAGTNVSDRADDWKQNYRCPDVAVFLNETQAQNRQTHWYGGPDFAVEVVSPDDRSREKLEFYAKVNTRELLIVDRDPWVLELYRLDEGKLNLAGTSTVEEPAVLRSEVVPLTWQLADGEFRPLVEVAHLDGNPCWTI